MAETMKAGMDAAADVYIQEEIQASGGAMADGPDKHARDAQLYSMKVKTENLPFIHTRFDIHV